MKAPEIIFTGGTATGTITCRQCGKTKDVDLSNFKHYRKNAKVKCACGAVFEVLFEARKFYRKKVQIKGKLLDAQSCDLLDEIIITDISVGGISFTTDLDNIKLEDVFNVSFTLDDESKALVEEEVIIKRVKSNYIGAEFVEKEKYNFDLDFYLMPFSIVD